MSIRFSVMKWLVQLLGTKRLTSLPPEKMLRRIRHANQRNHFFVPQDEEFLYRDEVISLTGIDGAEGFADQEQKASFHCLTICHKEQAENAPKKRGILCVYGGGMLLSPPRLFVGFAKDMAKRPVWMYGSLIILCVIATRSATASGWYIRCMSPCAANMRKFVGMVIPPAAPCFCY